MWDQLSSIFDMFRAQLINVPLNNTLSIIYAILNVILMLFTPLFGG
jgi:hypothetical protein